MTMFSMVAGKPATDLPPDFDALPRRAQRLLDRLVPLPTWRAHGYAWPGNEWLEDRTRDSRRTVQRAALDLELVGEVERVTVPYGGTLPDGTVAYRTTRIFVPGPAMRARRGLVVPEPVTPPASGCHGGGVTVTPYRSHLTPITEKIINAQPPPEPQTAQPPPIPAPAPSPPTPAEEDKVATHAILEHFARATGRRPFATDARLVEAFVWEMAGSRERKVAYACRAVDEVLVEQRAKGKHTTSLRYVFNGTYFWPRLERFTRDDEAVRRAIVDRMHAEGVLMVVEPSLAELDPVDVAAERIRVRDAERAAITAKKRRAAEKRAETRARERENKSHGGDKSVVTHPIAPKPPAPMPVAVATGGAVAREGSVGGPPVPGLSGGSPRGAYADPDVNREGLAALLAGLARTGTG